ncbi:myb/SANT-like DNA-binding domain-containing protein 4 isoform X2 [Colias croceus]|nr:myb/SANT-like DNA-binding domain-containing protein 4 isoform X2 [Colias croceus]
MLNSVGGNGVNKTSDKWKKVWSDWKTKTKKKASLINRDVRGTGGGPGRGKPLSRLEERVLRLIGITAFTGTEAIEEAGFQEPSQPQGPQVNRGETEERIITSIPAPEEMTMEALPLENTVPNVTSASRAHPVSPVPGPSHSRTIQGERSPVSAGPSTPRRRRRCQTPFDRATSEFVAIEGKRLRFERERDARLYELETERLKIEAQRIQVDRERVQVEAERVRVEEVRTRIEADIRDSTKQLNSRISQLILLLENLIG